jgi:hypothetical protein
MRDEHAPPESSTHQSRAQNAVVSDQLVDQHVDARVADLEIVAKARVALREDLPDQVQIFARGRVHESEHAIGLRQDMSRASGETRVQYRGHARRGGAGPPAQEARDLFALSAPLGVSA